MVTGRDDSDLELDFWDLEIVIVDQVEAFPIFLEGSEVITDVVSDDGDGSLLTFILVDSLEVFPGCVGRRTMLDMDERFIGNILSN